MILIKYIIITFWLWLKIWWVQPLKCNYEKGINMFWNTYIHSKDYQQIADHSYARFTRIFKHNMFQIILALKKYQGKGENRTRVICHSSKNPLHKNFKLVLDINVRMYYFCSRFSFLNIVKRHFLVFS